MVQTRRDHGALADDGLAFLFAFVSAQPRVIASGAKQSKLLGDCFVGKDRFLAMTGWTVACFLQKITFDL
jgi:hypothetical protein